jgi:hypothetical protein
MQQSSYEDIKMAKAIPDSIIDGFLSTIGDNATQIVVCKAEPANYSAVAGETLATAVRAGSFTLANGDVSGRKGTYAAESAIPITVSGTATHVVLTDGSSIMYLVTTSPNQALTSGGTVDTSAFDHEILDPT